MARAFRRPAILPAPAFALRALLGEMSQLMLMSERVIPERTLEAGYKFKYTGLHQMLSQLSR
jgi:NAD dependent epimerase/dehydratase family enzyme